MNRSALAGGHRVSVGVGCARGRSAAGGREDARQLPGAQEAPRRHFAAAEDPGVREVAQRTGLPALNQVFSPHLECLSTREAFCCRTTQKRKNLSELKLI